ncbi:hypothetical protein AG0111_0g7840 [Alternaria gaisen]|uniref:Uncharacterized protein n=1 Tax=Alternaria gaisen TaxID=167740 RepID=A0ACB6FIL2_9PLEO|nr:hypothetical protein AG0111_0g7840 [Alternaria gaisen]
MSDENTPKGASGKVQGWTEHEVLVYLLSAMESANMQIDFNSAPVPAGRNAGIPITAATEGALSKKPATPRKRKPKADDEDNDAEITPKKGRGRPKKKAATPEIGEDQEDLGIKSEFHGEDEEDDILKEAELIRGCL